MKRLSRAFFLRDVLDVAPDLIGKIIRLNTPEITGDFRITETEAYRGEEDKACHAHKGKTPRTMPMYENGGILYLYLIYGMYWMLNVVCETEGNPQAVLIRGIEKYNGPGKLTKALHIDKSFNQMDICTSDKFSIWDDGLKFPVEVSTRIGIDYAGEIYKNKPWRWILKNNT